MTTNSIDSDDLAVFPVGDLPSFTSKLDALVVAAGFEERAFKVLPKGTFGSEAHCILIRFRNGVEGNDQVFETFFKIAATRFQSERLHIVELRHGEPQVFESELRAVIEKLPESVRYFGIDISGMPSYSICIGLKALRDFRSEERIAVLYTAAKEYNPTLSEYEKLLAASSGDLERVPRSMALEMRENLILDTFSGYRSQNAKVCLAVFAGYEVHRSAGVIEAVNPALLLLLYGNPGDNRLAWRLDLSRRLHRKFEKGRRTAVETVSTLRLRESLDVLERYYNYLIDDYDLVISPISSKMHVVASYLFWEKYGEVQLTFPIPIGYDRSKSPCGIGTTYATWLDARQRIFRARPTITELSRAM